MTGAVVFDLDNTLYPERRFALSGYAAVARHLEATAGVCARTAFSAMLRSLRRGRRALVFQDVVAEFGLPAALTAEWLAVYRAHRPRLRLPVTTARALMRLRSTWAVGILTNGLPVVQRAKVGALGLSRLVDAVVYAEEHGVGQGKPDPAVFMEALRQLGARPEASVFVGDDPSTDIAGARAVGMRTVLNTGWCARRAAADADAVISSLVELPGLLKTWAGEGIYVS